MALKLANNASGRLATHLSTTDTTVVLQPGQGATFPSLGPGDWFPITVLRPDGTREIMYATAISGDTLTVQRAKENTAALSFLINDRVELRATAGVFADKLSVGGGAISGNLTIAGDLTSYRPGTNTGVVFLNQTNDKYLFFDGTNYNMPGAHLNVNGHAVWTTGNLNPGAYLPLTGGTLTGGLTLQSTALYITFSDLDWGVRYIHCNDGNIGFLNNGGGWACYSTNDGTFIASGNIGAYSDRKHKKHIQPIKSALDLINRLRGVRYTDKRTGQKKIGLIAQEVQDVVPEVVGNTPDGLFVDYQSLVAPLIQAVKELAARVQKLEGR